MPEQSKHQLELVSDSARERLLARVRKARELALRDAVLQKNLALREAEERKYRKKCQKKEEKISNLRDKFLRSFGAMVEKELHIHCLTIPRDELAELPALVMRRAGYKAALQFLTLPFVPFAKAALWALNVVKERDYEDSFVFLVAISVICLVGLGVTFPIGLYNAHQLSGAGAILMAALGWTPALLIVTSMAVVNTRTVSRFLNYARQLKFTDRLAYCYRHYRWQKHLGGPEKLAEFMKTNETRLR